MRTNALTVALPLGGAVAVAVVAILVAVAGAILMSVLPLAWRVMRPTSDLSADQAADRLLQLMKMLLHMLRPPYRRR